MKYIFSFSVQNYMHGMTIPLYSITSHIISLYRTEIYITLHCVTNRHRGGHWIPFTPPLAIIQWKYVTCYPLPAWEGTFWFGNCSSNLKNPPKYAIAHSWNCRRDWVCPPQTIPDSNAKMLILLFYVLKRCFLNRFGWTDPVSVSFRSVQ